MVTSLATGYVPARVTNGLAVYRIGAGAPVLLMPGPHRYQQPGDGSSRPLVEGLVACGRQVISFDPPGAGRSTRSPQVSMEEMHACADEALAACGVAAAPLPTFGHSMAGLVTLAYALERPRRVAQLVLVGTGSGGRAYRHAEGALWSRGHPGFVRMAALGMLMTLWPRRAPERLFLDFVRRQSFVDASRSEAASLEPIALGDWLHPRRGRPDWQRVAARADYSARLGQLRVPTLVLCGEKDPQFPLACSRELASAIPGARLETFARSGHYPFIEEAERFWGAVNRFLIAEA